MNDYVRLHCKGYIPGLDREVVIKNYGSKKYIHPTSVLYTFSIQLELLKSLKKNEKNEIRIQKNNSSDTSTLEMLDILAKFKNEQVKIITILSYGDLSVKEEIISKGVLIFGEKFEYVEKIMPPEEYANHLMQNDILILAQDRQQGFGNTVSSLYLGKKVFIREDISVYEYLNKIDIKVFNTNSIKNLDYNELLSNDSASKNAELVVSILDTKIIAKNCDPLF